MAGDWIKMRTNLLTDPAIAALTSSTSLDEFAIIGRLHTLWSWADQHTRNGYAAGVTKKWLDAFLRYDGICDALESVGWLRVDDSGVRIPKFDKHNGQSGKSRALTNRRMAEKRLRDSDAETVTKSSPEKRRGISREDFDLFWDSYPKRSGKKVGKQKCVTLFASLSPDDKKLAIAASKNYAQSSEAKRNFARDPERFLKSDWWRDWIEPADGDQPSRVATDADLASWSPHGPGVDQ